MEPGPFASMHFLFQDTSQCLLIYRAGGLSGEESTCQCRRHRQEMWVQSPGQEDPLEEEIETQSSVLAWKIPYAEEPGRLQTMRSQRVGHDWAHTHTHTQSTHTHTHTHTHSHTDRHTTQAPDSQAFKSSCLSPLSLCLVKWMLSQWTEVRPIPWSSSLLKVSSAPCRSGVSTVLRREETLPHQPQEGLFIGQGKPKLDSRFTHLKMELVKLRINK